MDCLKCVLYLAVIGCVGFFAGRVLPYKWINEKNFWFSVFPLEQSGKLYEKIGVHKWQNKVPDMSRIFPNIMPAKELKGDIVQKLPAMIKETCIAELTHILLGVAGLYCLCIWEGIGGIVITLLYEFGNLPFILVQRYNRPRLCKLWERKIRSKERKCEP